MPLKIVTRADSAKLQSRHRARRPHPDAEIENVRQLLRAWAAHLAAGGLVPCALGQDHVGARLPPRSRPPAGVETAADVRDLQRAMASLRASGHGEEMAAVAVHYLGRGTLESRARALLGIGRTELHNRTVAGERLLAEALRDVAEGVLSASY